MAEINNGTNNPIINYGVSSKKSKIYRSSKEPQDGFEKVELQSGGVTYHKYINGLSGKITYLERDKKTLTNGNDLDNLKIFLNDGTTTQSLALKTYSGEWKLAIKHLFYIDFSKEIEISFYKTKKGDKTYNNCFVRYSVEEVIDEKAVYPTWLDTTTVEKGGEVPNPVKNKKGELDWTDNDLYYLDKLETLIKRFKEFKA